MITNTSVNPHWDLFRQFALAELRSGGPDPQVLLTARAVQSLEWRRATVAAGWFVVPYTCGAAAALWGAELWDEDEELLRTWLVMSHEGVPTRRERRSIWGTDKVKFARSMASWRDWADYRLPHLTQVPYSNLYDSISSEVAYFGRYATMKVIEVLHQAGLVSASQSDLRARGAKYPRKTLGLLWPEHADVVNQKGDPRSAVELAQRLAEEVRAYLASFNVTWFQVETLLCNYRQSLDGKYPGRSHDRELAHWVRAEQYWGQELRDTLPFFDLRRQLFPAEYLGELGHPPWWAARERLEVAEKAHVRRTLACTSV